MVSYRIARVSCGARKPRRPLFRCLVQKRISTRTARTRSNHRNINFNRAISSPSLSRSARTWRNNRYSLSQAFFTLPHCSISDILQPPKAARGVDRQKHPRELHLRVKARLEHREEKWAAAWTDGRTDGRIQTGLHCLFLDRRPSFNRVYEAPGPWLMVIREETRIYIHTHTDRHTRARAAFSRARAYGEIHL